MLKNIDGALLSSPVGGLGDDSMILSLFSSSNYKDQTFKPKNEMDKRINQTKRRVVSKNGTKITAHFGLFKVNNHCYKQEKKKKNDNSN